MYDPASTSGIQLTTPRTSKTPYSPQKLAPSSPRCKPFPQLGNTTSPVVHYIPLITVIFSSHVLHLSVSPAYLIPSHTYSHSLQCTARRIGNICMISRVTRIAAPRVWFIRETRHAHTHTYATTRDTAGGLTVLFLRLFRSAGPSALGLFVTGNRNAGVPS